MITHELPLLFKQLREEFDGVTGMSVALSGSLARGDHRTGRSGRVVSDLDLIPVVPTAADAPAARTVLEPILNRLAQVFAIEATAAITTRDAFTRAARAHYRSSMRPEWLTDGLGLGEDAFTRPAPDIESDLPWAIQPITYYLAKATEANPKTNLVKARRAAIRLVGPAGVRALPGSIDDLPGCMHNLINEHRLAPLDSTIAFLDSPTRPGIGQTVRTAVFRENQGLPCDQSAVVVLPSIPN